MGLSDFFRKLTGRNSDSVELERVEEETRMDETERRFDQEDYEAKRDDIFLDSRYPTE